MTENASTETQETQAAEIKETSTNTLFSYDILKAEASEEFAKLVAEEEKIVQEAQRIAHVVVQEVEQIAVQAEVAAENVVRKAINVVIPHGGGSVIKNPG